MKRFDDKVTIVSKPARSSKAVSVFLSILVIGMLVFVGPVDAYRLQITGLQHGAYRVGDVVNFLATAEINSNEIVPIKNISLEVNDQIVCTFDVSGNPLTPCFGINITQVSGTSQQGYGYGYNTFQQGWNGNNNSAHAGNWTGYGYGYGYGYGSGEFVYNISIQTPQAYFFYGGNNRIKLITTTETQTLNSRTQRIIINPVIGNGNGYFLMSTNPSDIVLWGTYNSTDHTLAGELRVLANSSLLWIAVGDYNPHTPTSGDISLRIYDALTNDVGIFWDGNYSSGVWNLHPRENVTMELSGNMFLAPQ